MPATLDRSYDGIIIGAGHHGLVLGSYLARCGLDILLVDRRLQYGGALVTEEVTAPGFYHNLHSINHFHISETPWFKDLGLGRPSHLYYAALRIRPATPRRLRARVRARSRGDARQRRALLQEGRRDLPRLEPQGRGDHGPNILLPERFSEPLPQAEREALLSRSDIGRDFLAATKRQPIDVVQELFENEHVQLLFLFKISLFGTWLVDTMSKTSPMGSVIRAFDLQSGYQLCQGGSANLARGLMETFIAAGGRFAPQVELERIVIEGGKATGIDLKDGRTVRARQFVASTLNVHQTFEDYIGRAQLPAAFLKKLDGFEYTKWTIFGLHLALHEPVCFHAEKFDPNIHRTLKWSLGAETMDELLAAHQDVMADRVPQVVQFGSGALSVLDPAQAPPGKHTTYAWHVMPLNPDIGSRDYETFKQEFAERIIEKWARYAPNMTRKNIIAQHVYTAREYTQTFPEMRGGDIFMGAFSADQVMYNHFGYRTPIERLYMAGSATHPGGAISGGGGYISAGVIARDLGLKPWWKPWDAAVALGAVPAAA